MNRLNNPRHIRRELRRLKKYSSELLEIKDFSNRRNQLAAERLYAKIGEIVNKLNIENYHTSIEKELRKFRNEIAHDNIITVRDLQQKKSLVSRFFDKCSQWIERLLPSSPQASNYEQSGLLGTKKERSQITDAILDQLNNDDNNKADLLPFPKSEALASSIESIKELMKNKELRSITKNNDSLTNSITDEMLTWIKGLWKKMVTESPFEQEKNDFEQFSQYTLGQFWKERKAIQDKAKSYYPTMDYSYFEKKSGILSKRHNYKLLQKNAVEKLAGTFDAKKTVAEILSSSKGTEFQQELKRQQLDHLDNFTNYHKEKILLEKEALKDTFLNEWANSLKTKTAQHELELIDKERQKFARQLYEKVDRFKRIKNLVQPFFEDLGRLWDLSDGQWVNTDFNALLKYTKLLEQEEQLRTLAMKLGRYRRAEAEYELKTIQETKTRIKWKPNKAMKSEMVGIMLSDNLQYALPHELALASKTETRPLFLRKFAEKELLTYKLEGIDKTIEEYQEENKKKVRKPKDKGPFIICVDTSGSMHGTPEEIAKILCLAILKQSLDENRPCYLISFSTKIQTMELSNLTESMDDLVQFLSMSFHGGTDASPALESGLEMMQKNTYKNADLLMISDFVMDGLSKTLTNKLTEAKKNKNRFYSLSIGNSGNAQVLNGFNENWIYDPTKPESMNQLIKQVDTMKW